MLTGFCGQPHALANPLPISAYAALLVTTQEEACRKRPKRWSPAEDKQNQYSQETLDGFNLSRGKFLLENCALIAD
jgi:hypothetical protein